MQRKLVVLLLAVGLFASGCALAGEDPVLVGAVYPTGGTQGPGGIEEYRGAKLAAERVNELGGIDGRPIRLELIETDTLEAAPGAVTELAGMGAEVVVGSYGSTISRAAAAAASRLGVVFWETGAVGELGMTAARGERVFRFPASGGVLGHEAVAFVRDRFLHELEETEPVEYAVAYVDDVYGRSVGIGAIEEIERSGLPLAGVFPYDPHTADYEALAVEIAESGADVLVVSAYLEDGIELRRATLDIGLLASIGTSSSYCMREFGAALGPDAVGLLASDKPTGEHIDPERLDDEAADALRWAREAYRERFGDVMTAPVLSGFAGAWALFRHVLPQADEATADAIAEAALAVDLPEGALPDGSGLEIAPPGHPDAGGNLRAAHVIWQWVASGQREIVWPPSYRTHPILAERL